MTGQLIQQKWKFQPLHSTMRFHWALHPYPCVQNLNHPHSLCQVLCGHRSPVSIRPHAGCWTSECAASIAVPKQTRGPFCGPSTLRGQHGVLVLAAGCSARAHQPALQRACQLSIYIFVICSFCRVLVSLARAGGVFGTSGANPVHNCNYTVSQ